MKFRSNAGSTLIELLISITLVGVILVIIMGAFRIGIRAWETGERDGESFQRQQIVLSILKRQLSSVCWRSIAMEGREPFLFQGNEGGMEFVSGVSVVPGNDVGKVRVTYRVGRRDENRYYLEMTEFNFITGNADETIDTVDEDKIYALMPDVYDLRFEYLKEVVPEEENQWQPEWNPEVDAGLPAAVKCVLRMDEKKPPVTVIARVLSGEDISETSGK